MLQSLGSTLGSTLFGPYEQRGTYKNQKEAFLALMGYSVGLGNFWRFPDLCMKYGGVMFLIPYFVALATIGLPLYFLEIALSQYTSIGPMKLYGFISPLFRGMGWAMVFVVMLETIYYNIMIAWTIFYIGASFQSTLPWCEISTLNTTKCSEIENHYKAAASYFNQTVLGYARFSGSHASSVHGWMLLCLGVAWFLVAATIARGIRTSGKVLYVTVGVAYIILPFLLVFSYATSEKVQWLDSFANYLEVDSAKLWERDMWVKAATQAMYSLGLAQGGINTLASYNTFRQNILRDAILLVFVDTVTSLMCTYVVFGSLFAIAEDLPKEGPANTSLVFVVFPAVLAKIDLPLWPFLVFCMVFMFGFDSQFAMVEIITSALFDQFQGIRRHHVPVVAGTCTMLFLLGIPMCTSGGIDFFRVLDSNINSHSFLFLGAMEVLVVTYVYGFKNFMVIIRDHMKVSVPAPFRWYFALMYNFITPLFMLFLLISSIVSQDWRVENFQAALGIAVAFSSFVIVAAGSVYVVVRNRGKRLQDLLRPTSDFCPEYKRREQVSSQQSFELQQDTPTTLRFHRDG